jgi:hypothetical protein
MPPTWTSKDKVPIRFAANKNGLKNPKEKAGNQRLWNIVKLSSFHGAPSHQHI